MEVKEILDELQALVQQMPELSLPERKMLLKTIEAHCHKLRFAASERKSGSAIIGEKLIALLDASKQLAKRRLKASPDDSHYVREALIALSSLRRPTCFGV